MLLPKRPQNVRMRPAICRLPSPTSALWLEERPLPALRGEHAGNWYASIEAKMARVKRVLSELAQDEGTLRSLVAWSWIRANLDRAMPLLIRLE